ncbi:MAG: Ig-like domain-containing protein [Pseudomonadota bacterium]
MVVPLEIEHVAPPPPPIIPPYDYGAVEGTVDLNLVVDDIDYSELLFTYPDWPYSRHYVYGYGGRWIYANPGDYFLNNVRTGTHTYRVRSYLYDENFYQNFYWPYTDGDYQNDRVEVFKDQTTRKDFMNEAGILSGQLTLKGSLKTKDKDVDWFQLRAYGTYYYQPGVGYVYLPTYGGSSYETIYPNTVTGDYEYRMFLTTGPWQPYYLYTLVNNTDLLGYSGYSYLTMYDYNYYYDGNNYDFGQPIDIIGGQSSHNDREYRIGGVSMCFEVVGGGSLRSPYVSGSANLYNKDGKREMYVSVSGSSTPDVNLVPNPEVILYGPDGDYSLSPRAYTEDNTYINFPPRTVTLSQSVFKRRCLTSPGMTIDSYTFDLTTDIGTGTATATVSGNATDNDGILRIEFWLDGVKVHVIDYSATAEVVLLAQTTDVTSGLLSTSVDFSYDFDLTAGLHTIRVVAVDGLGNESYDEWEVEVNSAPVANGDSFVTLEDTPLNIAVTALLANDSDADGDVLSLVSFTGTGQGVLLDNHNGSLTYTPNPDFWGEDSFTYTISDGRGGTSSATVSISITPVNDPPLASDDAYTTDEDVVLVMAAPGVLANDSDIDGDPLTASLETAPAHGSVVVNPDGSFSYTPYPDYNGPDGFSYLVADGNGASDSATVSLIINPVNDPPVLSVDTASQSVQYSDRITQVKFSAMDIDSAPSEFTTTWTELPSSLSLSGSCLPSADGSSCSWTLDGQVLVGAGPYTIALTLSDGQFAPSVATELSVTQEYASAVFDDANPVSVRVASDGGTSGLFDLVVYVTETVPDLPAGLAAPGDITLANVGISLVPVGPGGTVPGTACTTNDSLTGVRILTCSFNGVPVETYTVEVTIGGNFYSGSAEDVLTVYDPSLGFTTGGGWFNWPGTGEKTNFGYTMKYGSNETNVKGSLLLIRHLADGQKYRIKSNALDGLAIGQDPTVPYGWASFSGKATYLEPGMLEAEGNHGFTVYVEDRDEPGSGTDRVWLTTRDKVGLTIPAMSLPETAPDNAVAIQGGNIVAPH